MPTLDVATDGLDPTRRGYLEEFGLVFEDFGLPKASGLIVAALLIADDGKRTIKQLCEEVELSKAHASATVRQLEDWGLLQKTASLGERAAKYSVVPDLWTVASRRSFPMTHRYLRLADQGLRIVPKHSHAYEQLKLMQEWWQFLETELPGFYQRFESRRQASKQS